MILRQMTVKASDLQPGDLVSCDGALVLLACEPHTYPNPQNGMTVYSFGDMPVVAGKLNTFSWLTQWSVQGNDLTRWEVYRPDNPGMWGHRRVTYTLWAKEARTLRYVGEYVGWLDRPDTIADAAKTASSYREKLRDEFPKDSFEVTVSGIRVPGFN